METFQILLQVRGFKLWQLKLLDDLRDLSFEELLYNHFYLKNWFNIHLEVGFVDRIRHFLIIDVSTQHWIIACLHSQRGTEHEPYFVGFIDFKIADDPSNFNVIIAHVWDMLMKAKNLNDILLNIVLWLCWTWCFPIDEATRSLWEALILMVNGSPQRWAPAGRGPVSYR